MTDQRLTEATFAVSDAHNSRLAELQQTCSAPYSDFSAWVWCGAANEALEIALAYRDALLEIIETAGGVRMHEGRSYRRLWQLLDSATDRWFA